MIGAKMEVEGRAYRVVDVGVVDVLQIITLERVLPASRR